MSESGRKATFIPGYYYVAGRAPGRDRSMRAVTIPGQHQWGWTRRRKNTLYAILTPADLETLKKWARTRTLNYQDWTIRIVRDKTRQAAFDLQYPR